MTIQDIISDARFFAGCVISLAADAVGFAADVLATIGKAVAGV